MQKLRIGIIGLGMASGPHIRGLIDLQEEVEVILAYSRSSERREQFQKEYPQFKTTGNISDILLSSSIDAILILTPPNSHQEIVKEAVRSGKHILIEKPLDVTIEGARQIVETCRAADVRLGVVLQRRLVPAITLLREIIRSGRLGGIAGASVTFPCWRPQVGYYDQLGRGTKVRDGGGVLLTQSIHIIDAFLSVAPEPTEVFAYARTTKIHQIDTEDIVAASLAFEGGAIGTLDTTTAAFPGFPEEIRIIGERGTAIFQGAGLQAYFDDGTTETLQPEGIDTVSGTGENPMDFPYIYHRELLRDFVASIRENRDPVASGEDGLKTQEFIDAIMKSAASGERVKLS